MAGRDADATPDAAKPASSTCIRMPLTLSTNRARTPRGSTSALNGSSLFTVRWGPTPSACHGSPLGSPRFFIRLSARRADEGAAATVEAAAGARAVSACRSRRRVTVLDIESLLPFAAATDRPGVLLRTLEQAAVDRFAENVSLHRLHHVRARLERIGRRFDGELRV